jgi:hypothetical protein
MEQPKKAQPQAQDRDMPRPAHRQRYPDKVRQQNQEWNRKYYTLGAQHARNRGQPWTSRQDAAVLAQDVPDRQLAIQIGRTVKSIEARRAALKEQKEAIKKGAQDFLEFRARRLSHNADSVA